MKCRAILLTQVKEVLRACLAGERNCQHLRAGREFLRGQASPPSGPDDYMLGSWQLHTHHDLIGRLREVAPWQLIASEWWHRWLLASDEMCAVPDPPRRRTLESM
jgi:hypothetical protein